MGIYELTVWKYKQNRILKLPPRAILGCAVAARHFLVLLHFICMKISHGSMIYIIDEGSRSALQSLEQNFPWYAPPTTATAAHSSPLLSSSHPSLHSFLLPYALPLECCFIPHQLPFIPLQPFGLLSFHPSISQTLHLYFHPSTLPSFTYSAPPPTPRSERERSMRAERWEPAGPPPAVPPYVDLSPPVPYWFCFKQGKNTRRMRCRRWHEIIKKTGGKGEREWGGRKEEKCSYVSNLWVVSRVG